MMGERVEVYRGDTDKYGNPNKAAHGSVEGVFAWGTRGGATTRARRDESMKGESVALQVEFYVERGVDLRARDRIKRGNGQVFSVVAGPLWDQVHPFDGFDFGWAVYQVEVC